MKRLVVVVLGCVALSGCLSGSASVPHTESTHTPTELMTTAAPTDHPSADFEYVVRAGSIPASIEHVYVDFSVSLAEHPRDLVACTDGAPLHDNKYDPTPTPLPTPAGQCLQFDAPRVDIASLNGTHSVGHFTTNATPVGAHTLVVDDVTIVLANGTTASDVYDTDFRALEILTTPSGTYGVVISITDYRDTDKSLRWRFGVEVARFDPTA